MDLDFGLDRLQTLLQCASNKVLRTSRPYTPAQPKHQIPIRPTRHTAGSFLGDFRTPNGIRNSSRDRNGGFLTIISESGRSMGMEKSVALAVTSFVPSAGSPGSLSYQPFNKSRQRRCLFSVEWDEGDVAFPSRDDRRKRRQQKSRR
jgi:hypothetical protein